jgi:hypothetical protein
MNRLRILPTVMVLLAIVATAACSGAGDNRERCVALLKKENQCVPDLPVRSDEGRSIQAAGNAGMFDELGVSSCMLQFKSPESLVERGDQRLAATYKSRLECAEKSKTCDEYMTCACAGGGYDIECKLPR